MGTVLQWFTHNPLGSVGIIYAVAIIGVIIYTFLEYQPEDEYQPEK